MNTEKNLQEKLQKTLSPYIENNQISHYYACCGRFDAKPSLKLEFLPEGFKIFDLASLTKALVTTPLIFQELEKDSSLNLDQTVKQWLGEEKAKNLDKKLHSLTIRSLLQHQSGLPAWFNFWINSSETSPKKIFSFEHKSERERNEKIKIVLNRAAKKIKINQGFVYSDVGFILLGYILEQRSQVNLSKQFNSFKKRILYQADEEEKYPKYLPNKPEQKNIISTGFCLLRNKNLIGEAHDENCASLNGISGHAGLFSSGDSLLAYLKCLIKSELGQLMLEENLRFLKEGNDPLCGWRQRKDSPLPLCSLGHLGFTGTAFWVSADLKKYMILLTNRVISGRQSTWIQPLRKQCYKIMQKAILF